MMTFKFKFAESTIKNAKTNKDRHVFNNMLSKSIHTLSHFQYALVWAINKFINNDVNSNVETVTDLMRRLGAIVKSQVEKCSNNSPSQSTPLELLSVMKRTLNDSTLKKLFKYWLGDSARKLLTPLIFRAR